MAELKIVCKKCGKSKALNEYRFRNDKGYHRRDCRQCERDAVKKWTIGNPDKVKEKAKKHYRENKEYYMIKQTIWREDNPDYMYNYNNKYRKKNIKKILKQQRQNQRERYHSNINYKLRILIGGRIRRLFNQIRVNKNNTTLELLGCSFEELKQHIENQFKDAMSWDNFYKGEIHIDHIRPCASFDLTDPEQQRACFNHMNLQPLWAEDNQRKGARVGV